jgi:hypothetical protein
MGAYGGPDIITDGLVFAVDAGSVRSYPGSGTVATDLVGSSNGTLTNGVGFSSSNGGYWDFDGTDDYIGVDNLGLSSHTIEGWIKSDNSSQGGASFGTIKSVIGNYDGGSSKYTYIGFIPTLTWRIDDGNISHAAVAGAGTISVDTWYHVALTYNASNGVTVGYLNGVQQGTINFTSNVTFNSIPFYLGKSQAGVYFDGSVALSRCYNRALTAAEVLQNYKAQKNRFL